MKLKNLIFAGSLAMFIHSPADAATDNNKLIIHLGVGAGVAYISLASSDPVTNGNTLSLSCPSGNIYIDTTTSLGQALLHLAMAARQSNIPLSRIDYAQDASGNCYASLIEF